MDIEYGNSKEVKCYRDFVTNPEDRSAMKAFTKMFGKNLMEPAQRLHERFVGCKSAGEYNHKFGNAKNRIELKKDCRNNDPLILKIRIGLSYRKFFNHIVDNEDSLLLKRDWSGDFNSVTTIYVIAVNNHDYDSV